MTKQFYFLSGLPRSGTTLLCNILCQNPRILSTHTSGCLDVLFSVRNQWSQLIEHQAHPDDKALTRVLRAVLESYYADSDRPVIVDKSRGWTAYIPMIEAVLGEKCKIICPIRPVPDILASMEGLHQETAKTRQPPGERENYFNMQTLAGRCEYWTAANNLVGLAYNRITDAVRCGYRDRLHFVNFADLTGNPKKTLDGIYEFLGELPFGHNFGEVRQVTTENDELHGYVNLHKIRSKVELMPSRAKQVLGEDLFKKYAVHNLEF